MFTRAELESALAIVHAAMPPTPQFAWPLLKARTGIDVTYVPYKGAAALNNDLIGGHIPAVFSVLPASLVPALTY